MGAAAAPREPLRPHRSYPTFRPVTAGSVYIGGLRRRRPDDELGAGTVLHRHMLRDGRVSKALRTAIRRVAGGVRPLPPQGYAV